MNAKFFADARARRLPYMSKRRAEKMSQNTTPSGRPLISAGARAKLNPLQIALLEQLAGAGFPCRWWPLRNPPVRRIYFTLPLHLNAYLSFSDPQTLDGARLHVAFVGANPEAHTADRDTMQEYLDPALTLCEQIRQNEFT